jgi:hypothetical protein
MTKPIAIKPISLRLKATEIRRDKLTAQQLDLVVVIRAFGGGKLCANNLNALAKLVHYLAELPDDDDKREAH